MHQEGEIFIEAVTEVVYDPVVVEELDQNRAEDQIHLTQDMKFKSAIRGWSHQAQQLRATGLLSLNDISVVTGVVVQGLGAHSLQRMQGMWETNRGRYVRQA